MARTKQTRQVPLYAEKRPRRQLRHDSDSDDDNNNNNNNNNNSNNNQAPEESKENPRQTRPSRQERRNRNAPRTGLTTRAADRINPTAERVKRPHRFRPGTVALRQIRQLQRREDLINPKLPFRRLVREVGQGYVRPLDQTHTFDNRWQESALNTLQQATEDAFTELFEVANLCAIHSKRVTLMPRDLRLVLRIWRNNNMHMEMIGPMQRVANAYSAAVIRRRTPPKQANIDSHGCDLLMDESDEADDADNDADDAKNANDDNADDDMNYPSDG